MVGCEHCKHLDVEVAEIRTIVERMDRELLGNERPGRCAEHGKRISRLERWRSWMTGALAAIGLMATTATALGAAMISHWKP